MHLAEQNNAAELQDVFVRIFFPGETEGDSDTGSARFRKHGGQGGTVLRGIFLKPVKKCSDRQHSAVFVEEIYKCRRGVLCLVETKCILGKTVRRERRFFQMMQNCVQERFAYGAAFGKT